MLVFDDIITLPKIFIFTILLSSLMATTTLKDKYLKFYNLENNSWPTYLCVVALFSGLAYAMVFFPKDEKLKFWKKKTRRHGDIL